MLDRFWIESKDGTNHESSYLKEDGKLRGIPVRRDAKTEVLIYCSSIESINK
jgi:hypothetical protein